MKDKSFHKCSWADSGVEGDLVLDVPLAIIAFITDSEESIGKCG